MGLKTSNWRNVQFYRNKRKEDELYDLVIGNKKSFALINTEIGGIGHESSWKFPFWVTVDRSVESVISLRRIEGFEIWDWFKVIEKAKHIFLMETSISYLPELTEIIAKKYMLFSRSSIKSPNYWEFHNILKKPKLYLPSEFVKRRQ